VYPKIIVPLDGSKLAECVFPHLESIAKGCGAAEISFIRVVETARLPMGVEEGGSAMVEDTMEKIRKRFEDAAKEEANAYLDRIIRERRLPNVSLRKEVLVGYPADTIAGYGEKMGADLIVIATHGLSGLSRWTMGSVADRVLRAACVPVLMVRVPGCVPGM
jgi:nucleotide-binding universal stress UspA family protein